ncbi:MAG TPA: polysaccharide biosynthesis C-terminal domain-containing protein, partial [Conexibacter sp.]|nr:polysaccharide biosynthesis C-terminal domain-containing protein [Conexibacter sp.]
VLQIQALTLIGSFVMTAANYVLLSLHRHRDLLIANIATLVASVTLVLVLAPLDGARGGAIATAGADTLGAVVVLFFVARAGVGVRPPWKAAPLIALAGAVGATPLLLDGLHPILTTAAGCLLFLLALLLCGRFPPELRELVSRRRDAG